MSEANASATRITPGNALRPEDIALLETKPGDAVAQYALWLGDDALILAQRLGWWISRAPELEEDVALANIALDQIGHAVRLKGFAQAMPGINHALGESEVLIGIEPASKTEQIDRIAHTDPIQEIDEDAVEVALVLRPQPLVIDPLIVDALDGIARPERLRDPPIHLPLFLLQLAQRLGAEAAGA